MVLKDYLKDSAKLFLCVCVNAFLKNGCKYCCFFKEALYLHPFQKGSIYFENFYCLFAYEISTEKFLSNVYKKLFSELFFRDKKAKV